MANKQKTDPSAVKRYKTGTDIPSQSSFKPEYIEKLIEHGKLGHSFAEFCADIGVSEQTGRVWRRSFAAFAEAHAIFITHSKKWWNEIGQKHVVTYQDENGAGEKFDTSLYKYMTGGRFNQSHQMDIDLPALEQGTADERHKAALGALARGEITPNQASTISQMLKDTVEIEAHSVMMTRLEKIEVQMASATNAPVISKVADEPEFELLEKDDV